jgi:hypothetical protein
MKGIARTRSRFQHRQGQESGYALLMALFLVATLLLLATIATPNVVTQGRREREQEMIWRGNQYVRAVRLYYQQNGRYPQTLEELGKANAAGVHFLRKAYTDPANGLDGSWRVIYVTPTGQLIGSVHYHSLQEMAVAQGFPGQLPAGAPAAAAVSAQQSSAQAPTSAGPSSPLTPGQQTIQPTAPGQTGSASSTSSTSANPSQPVPVGNLEAVSGPVLGGSVIGVASKVKQPSLLVFRGGKTYFDWEFIWNPLMIVAGGAPPPSVVAPAGAPATGNAASPTGQTAPPPQPGNP